MNKIDNINLIDYNCTNIIENIENNFDKIDIKDNISLTLIEVFDKELKNKNLIREFNLGRNSTLNYLKLSTTDTNIEYKISSKENANITLHLLDFDKNNKNILKTNLEEKDISLNINALVNLKKDSTAFNSYQITHVSPNTYSDIKIKHLLDDTSKAEFEATTVIENDALYSKGFQDSKTILLSDDASIKARPHLEILTDELEASHGATTGGLDKSAIYYLQSRGLSKEQATSILIEAFANVSIENIKDETIQLWVQDKIKEI